MFNNSIKKYILNNPAEVCRFGMKGLDTSLSIGPTIENDNKQMQDDLNREVQEWDQHLNAQADIRKRKALRVVLDLEHIKSAIKALEESVIESIAGSKGKNSVKESSVKFAKGLYKVRENKSKYLRAERLKANFVAHKIDQLRINNRIHTTDTTNNEQLSKCVCFPILEKNEAQTKRIHESRQKIEMVLNFHSNNFSYLVEKKNQYDRIQLPSVSSYKINASNLPECLMEMFKIMLYEAGFSSTTIEMEMCYISVAHTHVFREEKENNNEDKALNDDISQLMEIVDDESALLVRSCTPSKMKICFIVGGAVFIQVLYDILDIRIIKYLIIIVVKIN